MGRGGRHRSACLETVARAAPPPEIATISLGDYTFPARAGAIHAVVCLAADVPPVGALVSFGVVPAGAVVPVMGRSVLAVPGEGCGPMAASIAVELAVEADVDRVALIATAGGRTESLSLERP